ncbi:MAG: hypothetical protein L0J94_04035, partial [Corynebacterium flavescens]|nr:hypothetical protein [Corynebacterium flavescens]
AEVVVVAGLCGSWLSVAHALRAPAARRETTRLERIGRLRLEIMATSVPHIPHSPRNPVYHGRHE